MKKGRYVSASLKLLHNSNLLKISISGMPMPCSRGFSDTIVPSAQGFPNWGTCTPSGTFAYVKGYIY